MRFNGQRARVDPAHQGEAPTGPEVGQDWRPVPARAPWPLEDSCSIHFSRLTTQLVLHDPNDPWRDLVVPHCELVALDEGQAAVGRLLEADSIG